MALREVGAWKKWKNTCNDDCSKERRIRHQVRSVFFFVAQGGVQQTGDRLVCRVLVWQEGVRKASECKNRRKRDRKDDKQRRTERHTSIVSRTPETLLREEIVLNELFPFLLV
jgi:hypothetical protein